jgi:hypothetical protein
MNMAEGNCNCTYVTEPKQPARREPSGNCPVHGSS